MPATKLNTYIVEAEVQKALCSSKQKYKYLHPANGSVSL